MTSLLKKGIIALAFAGSLGMGIHAPIAYAQDAVENLETVGDASGLGTEDIRITIANLIRTALTFVGVIAVCIVLYGGFVWMTAGGDSAKVDRAKQILINGGIGLVIIFMSWSITTFIITSILGATGGGGSGGGSGSGSGGGPGIGSGGSSSTFTVTGIVPEGTQIVRNIQVQITFSHTVLDTSVEETDGVITVVNTSTGEEVEGTLSVSGKRVTFVPTQTCPAPNEDRFCFEENTPYTVTVTEDVENTSGVGLTCTEDTCSGSFTSGTLVDTEDPRAEMTAPDDRDSIAADSAERVEVQATDDAGVATADFTVDGGEPFESVVASGGDITDVILEAIWETGGLTVGETYEVGVVVTDVAGNTDEDAVSVTARPATCYNQVQDAGETGVDCGGDGTDVYYCGACEGSVCNEDALCGGSSSCEDGVCSNLPEISAISPDNGAAGTFVTISGTGFGNSIGFVYVSQDNGAMIPAELASCGNGWSDTELVVVIPEGAGDGPLSVMTSGGDIDYTNDEEGELVPDFDVNDTQRPSLCTVTPDAGMIADALSLSGSGFGESRGASVVIFGESEEAGSYTSWSGGGITATVPSLNEGAYSVVVAVDGIESNPVTFEVQEEPAGNGPTIVGISPSAGGVGQYLTMTGADFGATLGSVWFENNETGERTLGDINFPRECSGDIWEDTEIAVMVPDVDVGGYAVSVETSSGESSAVAFTVTTASPTPGLCALSPDAGNEGDSITLYGDNFGTTEGVVSFSGSVTGVVTDWADGEIGVTVPSGAKTGTLVVAESSGEQSNGLTFTVGTDTGEDEPSGIAAAYAWSFSSGSIPDVPEVIVACTDTAISAVPNDRFTNEACGDAQVYVEFTAEMNEATLDDALKVEKCTSTGNDPCRSTDPVFGTYQTTATSVTFSPNEDFDVATTYQVTVSTAAMSRDASALKEDVRWTFTTKADDSACEVESVIVSPKVATITAVNETQEFSALPVVNCNVLNADNFIWSWQINESYASISGGASDCSGGSASCATATALAEGVTAVTATETASKEQGSGELTINFTDPYITHYFPNCTEACTNATVGATFNVPMNETSVTTGASIYVCANELCTTMSEITPAPVVCTEDEQGNCVGFTFALQGTLTPSTYYRVVASGDMESASGVPLIRTNYGGDFSWTLRVREDATVCAVDRVTLSPSSSQSVEVGDQKVFTAEAYGEADSCSVSGQLLNASSYAWTWEDPIADEDNDGNSATIVADWIGIALSDADPDSVAEGCTASCTSGGSTPQIAICGDGIIGLGEECEDGNVTSGDGCSSSCVREGGDPVAYQCSGDGAVCANMSDASCVSGACSAVTGGCGDGIRTVFEDCDDGNTIDGDGCSAACLAEGSSSVGATCGNNDIAYDLVTYAGEECDDGNARNNDGCSSSCTNEGSPTLASLGGALCGDGIIDSPYEMCDDGNTNDDDGCSSQCLHEGSSLSYATPSVCNDGVIGLGEECEDGNAASGDGCSSKCLLEGSSAAYTSPSYCGDGVVGAGEVAACEAGAGGDGRIDAVQVAKIDDTAVFEIDPETNAATATLRTTESSSMYTAEAAWTLFCAATSDSDCVDPETRGVGVGNCCMDRPTASLAPAHASENVCRNGALSATFTQPMDTGTFTYENEEGETSYRMYAALNLASSGGVCPDTHGTLAQAPSGFFARAWYTVKHWFLGRRVLATAGDCVVPIEGYSQQESDGMYIVSMKTTELLYAGGEYTLIIEGDGNSADGIVEGVRSRYGVGMNGNTTSVFTVGSEICSADAVHVTDTHEEHPGMFTTLDDEHTYSATVLSYISGVPQEIAPIPGVYDWTWSSWETDNDAIVTVAQNGSGANTATVLPAGDNGTAHVLATLTIQSNTSGIETESSVSGYAEATALLCENPWPAIASYPWSDDEAGEAVGAEEGIGWTHFSLGYCRDQGQEGVDDDLPSLTVVSPEDTQDTAILKEYLFQVQNSADAIGIRVAKNNEYLSPMAWYKAQGFSGAPSETTINGFPAVEDGRTTYISAPNLDARGVYMYANMYIISRNGDAGDEADAIYDQIINNLTFATNISSVAYCSNGSAYTTACTSDSDCNTANGESCADLKAKIARDTRRLADMTDLRTHIQEYGKNNGYCSETTEKICASGSDCPSGESCVAGVPTLASGTFVRAFASSVWGSWNAVLGGALPGNIPADPLNVYQACGESPYEAYDPQTCVDETRGQYICPEGSSAYHYRAYGNTYAYIATDLEYASAEWYYPIDETTTDNVEITIGSSSGFADGFETESFCDGVTVYGGSESCGDGVIGAGEVCEVGDLGGVSVACDADGDGADDGYTSQLCNSTCTAFEDNPLAACIPTTCGNGVVESPEMCDDGTANGRYGYCGSDCTYDTAVFCGDGVLSGGELCDCGDADVFASIGILTTDRAYGASSVNSCAVFNGEYTASPNASCAWDCAGPASYCGDGEVTGGEVCDGSDDTWDGSLCNGGTNNGNPCATNNDCAGGGICGGTGVYDACALGFTRVLPCDDDAGASCTYTSTWTSVACTEIGSCGDGVVDPGEACDDGNTDSTDSCTATCTENVCGDGYLYREQEECDEGAGNGAGCDASYGSTCSACTVSCRQVVSSGAFCGDGVINGSEYCDGSDIPYQYFDTSTGTPRVYGACTPGDPALTDGGITYSCRRVGVCNGGSENGEYCTSSTGGTSGADYQVCDANGSSDVSCVFPSCADACTSSCPLTEVSASLLLTANLPGSPKESSVDVYSYSTDATSDLPNAATITMPACNVAGTLTGTIDMSNVDLPDAYVVFVVDRSGSMDNALGESSRMSVARDLLEMSVEKLYEGLGADMYISLVGYSQRSGTGMCSDADAYSCDSDQGSGDGTGSCPVSGATCDERLLDTFADSYGFATGENESVLQDRIAELSAGGSTRTVYALEDAKEMLDDVPETGNVRKIIVLLSDGTPTDSDPSDGISAYQENVNMSNASKDEGYEIYTVALTTSASLIEDMGDWSSNNGARNNENGIDYAYDGDTVPELEAAYQSIIDSILGVTVGVISTNEDDGSTELTTMIANEGNNVVLPWPENFTCDPTTDQEVPIQLTFLGEGTISLSNLRIEYCAP